jgi:uncharacterized protein
MKVSKYNVLVPIEDNKKILYNTISRKYISYNNSHEKLLMNLMENLNKGKYSVEELKYLKEMISKGIVIRNDIDEIDKIKFHQGEVGFQGQCFFVAVLPSLDYNFKLTYYWEKNRKIHMKEGTEENIIKFIDDLSKRVINIEIGWFGEETILEFSRISELTQKFEDVCKKNSCGYRTLITANGYLLTNEVINRLSKFNLYKIQIVLEDNTACHNRNNIYLKNTCGTYERIKDSIFRLSNKDILINLRIDVNEENYNYITELFDIIPENNRHKINIHICNMFKNKKTLPLFNIYKAAINKGYKYFDTKNSYSICEACMKSGFRIESTDRIVPCFTAVENEMCREGMQFSMCMLECKHNEYRNDNLHNVKEVDELSFHEKIKLHYYSDMIQIKIEG